MGPLELIASLSPQERMDMMMKGYRPGDITDVKKYRKSQGQSLSLQEKEERIKTLTGGVSDLGNKGDKEIYLPADRTRIPLEEIERKFSKSPTVSDYRQQMNEEMRTSSSNERVFNTDDILSLNSGRNQDQGKKSNKNLQMIANEGFDNAKEYLNNFVLNLQNEDTTKSYNLRLNIFKSLKKCLEEESKYKNNPQNLQAYRQGVIKAEKALLNKLQG